MSKKMLKTLAAALDITVTGAKTPVALIETPFLGGQGRSAILRFLGAVGGAGVLKIQGSNALGNVAPASGDASWFDIIAAFNAASALEQEIELPRFLRINVGTAGTGTVTALLEGIQ